MSGFALAEYEVPKFGLPSKVPGGTMPKDAGEFTSRLGQIRRQAGKVPGPGMYVGHKDWKLNRGFVFSKTPRDKGTRMNKVPAPGHYDSAGLSVTRPRSIGGQLSKGAKRSFLDNVAEKSGKTPAPDKYQPRFQEVHIPAPSFDVKKTESRQGGKKQQNPGPGHYEPKYTSTEDRPPTYGTSKDTIKSFVDRVTKLKEKLPAPGHYETTKLESVSRGTKFMQIMGNGRGPLMGSY